MGKIIRRTFRNYTERESDVKDWNLPVYYCSFCGLFVLITSESINPQMKRRYDNSLIVPRKIILRNNFIEGSTKLLKREKGAERQYRLVCSGCNVFAAYSSIPFKSLSPSSMVYILQGAITSDPYAFNPSKSHKGELFTMKKLKFQLRQLLHHECFDIARPTEKVNEKQSFDFKSKAVLSLLEKDQHSSNQPDVVLKEKENVVEASPHLTESLEKQEKGQLSRGILGSDLPSLFRKYFSFEFKISNYGRKYNNNLEELLKECSDIVTYNQVSGRSHHGFESDILILPAWDQPDRTTSRNSVTRKRKP